jgi:cell division protein FtsL
MSEPVVAEAYAPTLVTPIPDTAVVRAVDKSPSTVAAAVPRQSALPRQSQLPLEIPVRGTPKAPKPPRKRHLHVVRESSRFRLAPKHRARWLLSAAGVLAVLVAFGLVYLHVIAAQRQLPLDRLSGEVTQQEADYQRLRLEVAQLNSPSRLIPYAEGKLGMQEPATPLFVSPDPSNSVAPTTTLPSQAPTGDADWPQIKKLIAGTP